MDVTDYRIIEILQKDGRISMKDLGKIVGLTSPAVSERVKRPESGKSVIRGKGFWKWLFSKIIADSANFVDKCKILY